jgi:hypothetical protein
MMLATLVSPTLGWGMIASHDQLAHSAAVLGHIDDRHDHNHGGSPHHEHQDPHSFMGHLLTHMPFHLCSSLQLLFFPADQRENLTEFRSPLGHNTFEPPFKPPRPFLFV